MFLAILSAGKHYETKNIFLTGACWLELADGQPLLAAITRDVDTKTAPVRTFIVICYDRRGKIIRVNLGVICQPKPCFVLSYICQDEIQVLL